MYGKGWSQESLSGDGTPKSPWLVLAIPFANPNPFNDALQEPLSGERASVPRSNVTAPRRDGRGGTGGKKGEAKREEVDTDGNDSHTFHAGRPVTSPFIQ